MLEEKIKKDEEEVRQQNYIFKRFGQGVATFTSILENFEN